MTSYIAFDPHTQVTGAAPLMIVAGLKALEIDPQPFLERHGLADITADG